ncbi:response regulator [Flavitalea sp. BT771]|uniref:response regulator n=1 Tax=Flavitalea sp. BT771 TaxID=3063329 RepID=UPI0026E15A67|nr:response regulator [Flavitalea sp. BT771]MDO6435363.1 response regulator [Flavitalea sp. BT771]MDV6224277.1 response regulator [Flavitalea sp. BT771]
MNIVMRPGLLRNLQIGFGLSLLILVISSVASYSSIQNLLRSSRLVDHTDSVLTRLESVLSILKDAEAGQRGYLLTGDSTYLRPYYGSQERALAVADNIRAMTVDNPGQAQHANELYNLISQRLTILQQIIDEKRENNLFSLADLKKGQGYMDEVRGIVQRMQEEERRLLAIRVEQVKKFSGYTPVLILIAALVSLLITVFFYRRVHNDYLERTILYTELQNKDEEIGRRIGIISGIADRISDGDYQVRVSDEQKDNLGGLSVSLNKMAESLEYSFRQLSDNEWHQAGVARLNEILIGESDMKTLATNIVNFITEYTHSRIGAVYIMDTSSRMLVLQSTYALSPDSKRRTIAPGEGLVGQVAQDGKRMLVKDIPPGEWVVSFAAGSIRPRTMVAFPFFHEKKILGVIELGSLEYYTERELGFFSSIGENIGSAVSSIETRLKLQELLEETQAQSEELQAQHVEMENMNLELEVQAEKLQVSEEELKVQQEELQQTNQELEERSRSLEEKNQLILIRNLDIQKKVEELAQTTKYKSEFMANMSHELRTPLNSILLLSRLLAENGGKNLSSEQIEYAQVIQHSGQGLLELIDEILDLSRIESGKLQLEHTLVSVEEIVNDMRMLFVPLAKDKNLELSFVIDPETPAQIETDKMRLEQILKNLLSNAFKFTAKGSITLSIAPSARQHFIDLSVRDSGIGIPKEKHELIFEAFQQADGSTRRKYGGTGLGLSISRELAKLLGGDIVLDSKPDAGAAFKVSIPQFKMEATKEAPAPVLSKMSSVTLGENTPVFTLTDIPPDIPDDRDHLTPMDRPLLIVEDDAYFARALLEFGRKKGHKGIISVRGDTVVSLAKTYNPMGILLDIQLPVRNGWEVMDDLKKDPKTRHIPVHIISSFEVKNESLIKGAIDFISKPMAFEKMDAVFERIEYVLNRSSRKVLIIEDNTRHAEALSYFLGTHDVRSEIAHTIAESITMLEKEAVHCVILSREAADEADRESLDTIRKHPGLENIPIIVLTGKTISKGEEVRLRQYADSIVVKTAHSYQRILDEVSLFLHLVDGEQETSPSNVLGKLGALDEVLKNKTVLIADDDVRNIFSLTKALETHKMRVLSAMDGKEALAIAEEGTSSVDIVLMDMMMPEMDGFEAIARIRKHPRLKHIPIIAVTAKAMAGDREKCIQAGASDYISKPVDIDQLMSLLRIWLYEK